VVLTGSCNQKATDKFLVVSDSTGKPVAFYLTPEQMDAKGIEFGNIIVREEERLIPCSGSLIIPPINQFIVSSPASGKIIEICVTAGSPVKTGTRLARIQNIEFITLQEDFLETKNQLEFLQEEYKRQGELTVENATSIKKMQVAKRDYQTADLRLHALKLQLETLGINADGLDETNMSSEIYIKAGTSGNIQSIKVKPGEYVEKGSSLFEVVNNRKLQAELKVRESLVPSLKPGQPVRIFQASDTLNSYHTKVSSVFLEIDAKDQSAKVYAGINETNKNFMPGMAVKALINIGSDSIRLLNPRSIVSDSTGKFLICKKNGMFIKTPVRVGKRFGDVVELLEISSEITDSVVVSGSEYLNSIFNRF
jgi:cobalt-zinc-cadmium efflux system membrane fusion protein